MSNILKVLNEIFIEELDNEDIVLTKNSTADDIEEWDSLSHIQIIVAVEKHFNLKFTTQEIQSWKKVGDIISSIESKE